MIRTVDCPKGLSRLKGIETGFNYSVFGFVTAACPKGLSRLKGIETIRTRYEVLESLSQSERTFPFEGN